MVKNCKSCPKRNTCQELCREVDYQCRYYPSSRQGKKAKRTFRFDDVYDETKIVRIW